MKKLLTDYVIITRLNRPIGIWLLFLPCLFAIFLASKTTALSTVVTNKFIFLFLFGSLSMRSAGCIINDFFDKKFDAKVERTKLRPLAAKTMSQSAALILLVILLIISASILFQFNNQAICAGLISLPLIICYPLMKRITYYPQLFLGITFNFGIIIASYAINNHLTSQALLLYLASIFWTLVYDTIYAYQDIEDDMKIGVKSTAIRFGKKPQTILYLFTIAMFLLLTIVGTLAHLNIYYFLISAAAFIAMLCNIITCDFTNPQSCLKKFKQHLHFGFIISIAIFLG